MRRKKQAGKGKEDHKVWKKNSRGEENDSWKKETQNERMMRETEGGERTDKDEEQK